MKFSKLPKEKRQHLVLVVVVTATVLGLLGYFLIKGGHDKLSALAQKKKTATEKLELMQRMVQRINEIETEFQQTTDALTEKETGMATGDLYSWMQGSLRRFQRNYRVEIPQIGSVSAPEDVNCLTSFPYKQASLTIAGTAYYHDLGRFIADFENAFPLMRVINLNLDLSPTPAAAERDKLAFKMDIITLVKPSKT
jgi:Tfp pilus assembly protein PilO